MSRFSLIIFDIKLTLVNCSSFIWISKGVDIYNKAFLAASKLHMKLSKHSEGWQIYLEPFKK